jgi:hypothetical protein
MATCETSTDVRSTAAFEDDADISQRLPDRLGEASGEMASTAARKSHRDRARPWFSPVVSMVTGEQARVTLDPVPRHRCAPEAWPRSTPLSRSNPFRALILTITIPDLSRGWDMRRRVLLGPARATSIPTNSACGRRAFADLLVDGDPDRQHQASRRSHRRCSPAPTR